MEWWWVTTDCCDGRKELLKWKRIPLDKEKRSADESKRSVDESKPVWPWNKNMANYGIVE